MTASPFSNPPSMFTSGVPREVREADGTSYRLLGVGISNLVPAHRADPLHLIDRGADKRAAAERAMDKVRSKFGGEAVNKGRGLRK